MSTIATCQLGVLDLTSFVLSKRSCDQAASNVLKLRPANAATPSLQPRISATGDAHNRMPWCSTANAASLCKSASNSFKEVCNADNKNAQ